EELICPKKEVRSISAAECELAWNECSIPGSTGRFDLVFRYACSQGNQRICIRGQLRNSTLPDGVSAVVYRQLLTRDDAPVAVAGGFTGAVHIPYEQRAVSRWSRAQPLFKTGGYVQLGEQRKENYLSTRTNDTMLIAASHQPSHSRGMLVTRSCFNDP